MDYEKGLMHLKQLAFGKSWYTDFLVFEARLRENLEHKRLYGDDESNRSQRAQIIDRLNQLTSSHLGISFNELSTSTTPNAKKIESSLYNSQEVGKTSVPQKSFPGGPVRTDAFISFSSSPKDRAYLEELQTHLAYFIRKEEIHIWDKTKILPGSKWQEETRKALQAAKVAILLVSADFLASDAFQNELPPLLSAAEQEGAIILPIILRACAFEDSELAQFTPINEPSEPLSELSSGKRDVVWKKVAKMVSDTLKTARGNE